VNVKLVTAEGWKRCECKVSYCRRLETMWM